MWPHADKPVWDLTSTSAPCSMCGIAICCTSVISLRHILSKHDTYHTNITYTIRDNHFKNYHRIATWEKQQSKTWKILQCFKVILQLFVIKQLQIMTNNFDLQTAGRKTHTLLTIKCKARHILYCISVTAM